MKNNSVRYIIVYFLCFSVFNLQKVGAQQGEDSLFNAAVISVYDNPDHSIEIGKQILEQNKSNPEKQIQSLLLLSNAYASKRNYEKSLEYALQTKEINKTLKDSNLQLQILNKIAAQYHQLGVNEKALEVLDEADKVAKGFENQDSIRFTMGNNYAIRGFIYRDQLSCEIAINYLNKAYECFAEGPQNARTLANRSVTSYNKGNCYIILNQIDSAKLSYFDSKKLAEQAKANSLKAFSLKGLAEVYTLEGHYKDALVELQNAKTLARDVGDLVLNRGIFKGMADNYLALKDWNNYHFYDNEFEKAGRQIRLNEKKTIDNLLLKYADEIQKKKTHIKWKFGAGILIGFVAFFVMLGSVIWGEVNFQKSINRLKSQIKV